MAQSNESHIDLSFFLFCLPALLLIIKQLSISSYEINLLFLYIASLILYLFNCMTISITLICLLPILALSINFPMYKQCDSKWANQPLGTSPTNTICRAGCLMSSVAMALAGIGKTNYNPSTLNTWLKANSGYVQQDLFVWASVNPLGMAFTGFISNADISKKLSEGGIVILNVHNGGHWVLATGMSGNTIYVNDPGYSTTSYSTSEIVAGNTGTYRISKGTIGMMITELQYILKGNQREQDHQEYPSLLAIQ